MGKKSSLTEENEPPPCAGKIPSREQLRLPAELPVWQSSCRPCSLPLGSLPPRCGGKLPRGREQGKCHRRRHQAGFSLSGSAPEHFTPAPLLWALGASFRTSFLPSLCSHRSSLRTWICPQLPGPGSPPDAELRARGGNQHGVQCSKPALQDKVGNALEFAAENLFFSSLREEW